MGHTHFNRHTTTGHQYRPCYLHPWQCWEPRAGTCEVYQIQHLVDGSVLRSGLWQQSRTVSSGVSPTVPNSSGMLLACAASSLPSTACSWYADVTCYPHATITAHTVHTATAHAIWQRLHKHACTTTQLQGCACWAQHGRCCCAPHLAQLGPRCTGPGSDHNCHAAVWANAASHSHHAPRVCCCTASNSQPSSWYAAVL